MKKLDGYVYKFLKVNLFWESLSYIPNDGIFNNILNLGFLNLLEIF